MSHAQRSLRAVLIAAFVLVANSVPALAANSSAFLSGSVTSKGVPIARTPKFCVRQQLRRYGKNRREGPLRLFTVTAWHVSARGFLRRSARARDRGPRKRWEQCCNRASAPVRDRAHGCQSFPGASHSRQRQRRRPQRTALTQLPFNNSFSEMEIQMPGAVRGANGVVHINGDHGVINYMIDGVPFPQELNRDIGGEINLQRPVVRRSDRRRVSRPIRPEVRLGLQHVDARRERGRRDSMATRQFGSYTDASDASSAITPRCRRRRIRRRDLRRADDPRTRSAELRLAAQQREFDRPVRALHASRRRTATSPTSRFINSNSTYQIPNDVASGEPADDRRQRNASRHVPDRAVPPPHRRRPGR